MATRTHLLALLDAIPQMVDLSLDELVLDSVTLGGVGGTNLTQTILDSLISNSHAAGSDNQSIVAGAGIAGGGSGATVQLDVELATDPGLEFDAGGDAGKLRAKADETTIERHSSGLRVKDAGISTAKLAADSADDTKIRLRNNQYLRARNQANSLDVNIVKVNTADEIEFASLPKASGTPTASNHLVTKQYADSLSAGLDPKQSVRASTTAALPAVTYDNGASGVGATLTADANGALPSQDGVSLIVGDRLLVRHQAAALQNGIYEVTDLGDGSNPFILTRAEDQDGSPANEVSGGNFTFVEAGTTWEGSGWVVVWDGNVVVGTDDIDWAQFSDAGSAVTSVNGQTGVVVLDTDDINEGANQYFTDERAQDAVGTILTDSATLDLDYNDGTPSISGNVLSSPLVLKSMIAGESMAANTSFLVRMAVNGETAGRVYKATNAAAVADKKFYAFGIAKVGTAVSAGDAVSVYMLGSMALGSSDTPFNAADIGLPVYLTTAGGFSITAPTSSGTAAWRIGMVESTTSILVGGQQLNGVN